jgi:hypothetical protein
MTVYSKTNAGRLLAFEQKHEMAPAMRNLLKKVDGKTAYLQLIGSPDEAEFFNQLLARELVQIAPELWRNSAAEPGFTDSALNTSVQLGSKANQHQNSVNQSPPHLSLVAKPVGAQSPLKIETIKGLMASFIQTQLPQHADATLAEINGLTSEAQFLCMLSGYINLVDPAGKAGQLHVQQLLLTLAGNE